MTIATPNAGVTPAATIRWARESTAAAIAAAGGRGPCAASGAAVGIAIKSTRVKSTRIVYFSLVPRLKSRLGASRRALKGKDMRASFRTRRPKAAEPGLQPRKLLPPARPSGDGATGPTA